jgi:hypothetical protein
MRSNLVESEAHIDAMNQRLIVNPSSTNSGMIIETLDRIPKLSS